MGVEQSDFSVPVILTLCFLACSIVTCGAVVIHFIVKKGGLSDTASRLLFCLALSDLLGAGVWFIDIMFPKTFCPYSASLNMFGYQSAQIWTCIIGAYLIITCSAKLPPPEFIYYLIAYGLPVIFQIVIFSLHLYHRYPAPQGCWVQYGTVQMVFVTIPQLSAVALNCVFLGTIIYKMRISAKRWGLQSRDRGLFFVQICFLLTTLGSILESVPHGSQDVYTVAVCFGALQGFFNSLAMKQKALLQFMTRVKTRILPARKAAPPGTTPTPSTWLLTPDRQPPRAHPAMSDSYPSYYSRNVPPQQTSMTFLASTPGSHFMMSTSPSPSPASIQ